MRVAATVVVIAGIVLAFLLGLERGFDIGAIVIFSLLLGVGALALAVVRKSGRGTVGPATCDDCGGLISPNAPYCKHCAATAGDRPREAKAGS